MRFLPLQSPSKAMLLEGRIYIREQSNNKYASIGQWLWSSLYLVGFITSYITLLNIQLSAISIVLCALTGTFVYMIIAGFSHDAAHGCLSKYQFINSFFLYTGFSLVGVNGQLWRYRHLKKHHPFPNVKGSDVDADASTLIRLSPHNPGNLCTASKFIMPSFYTVWSYKVLPGGKILHI